jgi:uncharacterized protein (UPF0248 family)
MPDLRKLLNDIKWTEDLAKVEVWYRHRGAPQNMKMITGTEIVSIGKSFLETTIATIPYHRILRIINNGVTVFDRWSLQKNHKSDKQL